MPFIAGERAMLVSILQLTRYQDCDGSALDSCMKQLELWDNQCNSNYVSEVQTLISEYADLIADPSSVNKNPRGLREVELFRDYMVEFFHGAAGNEAEHQKLEEIKTRIENILDPEGELFQYSNASGTVIQTGFS